MFEKITEIIKSGVAWGREVAAAPDGQGSASRVTCLMVTTVTLGVLVAHVVMNHGLPSAEQMYGLAALVGTGAGAYAAKAIQLMRSGGSGSNDGGGQQ